MGRMNLVLPSSVRAAAFVSLVLSSSASAQSLVDNFNNNNPLPLWDVVDDKDSMSVREVNGRLEFSTTSSSDPAVNHYVGFRAKGWCVLTDSDVRARVRFRFAKQSRSNASAATGLGILVSSYDAKPAANNLTPGVIVGVGQYLPSSAPTQTWREIDIGEVGADGSVNPIYSWFAPGNVFFPDTTLTTPAFTLGESGTLYMRYQRSTDTLYLGLSSYNIADSIPVTNATLGLFKPVVVGLGGLANTPRPLSGANAWFDDFVIDQGVVLRAPSLIKATDGAYTNKVRVTWTAGAGAVSYKVKRFGSNGLETIATVTGTAYEDDTADPGVSYLYSVFAVARDGTEMEGRNFDGGWRNVPPPTGVVATDGTSDTGVTVSWNAVPDALAYSVYRKFGTTAPVLLDSTSSLSFVDTTAVPLRGYTYFVRANFVAGPTAASVGNTGWRNKLGPTTVTATDGTFPDRVVVTWTGVAGSQGYRVYRQIGVDAPVLLGFKAASARSFVDLTVPLSTTASYYVVSKHARGFTLFGAWDSGFAGPLLRSMKPAVEPTQPAFENLDDESVDPSEFGESEASESELTPQTAD